MKRSNSVASGLRRSTSASTMLGSVFSLEASSMSERILSRVSATSGRPLKKVFSAERLAFSDGSVVFGSERCPGIPSIPPTTVVGRQFTHAYDAELAEAIADIDKFERLHPTMEDDEEEREAAAALNRRAALDQLVPLIDINGDGLIDRVELRRAMPHAGDEELTRILQQIDLNGDGKVSAEEWVQYVLYEQRGHDDKAFVAGVTHLCGVLEAPLKAAVAATFAAADKDSSGRLDMFEVANILGRRAIDKGIKFQEIIEEFDASGDGEIDFEEFEHLFNRLVDVGLIPRPRYGNGEPTPES